MAADLRCWSAQSGVSSAVVGDMPCCCKTQVVGEGSPPHSSENNVHLESEMSLTLHGIHRDPDLPVLVLSDIEPAIDAEVKDLEVEDTALEKHDMGGLSDMTIMTVDGQCHRETESAVTVSASTEVMESVVLDELMGMYILLRTQGFIRRNVWSVLFLLLFAVALAMFVALPYVLLPFEEPKQGFWNNWVYNFVAHPMANYMLARCVVGWFGRFLEHAQAKSTRVERIVMLVPWVDSAFCLTMHAIFGSFGFFPVPMAILSSCIPGLLCSLAVAYVLLPKEVRQNPKFQAHAIFVTFMGFVLSISFSALLFYAWVFPQLTPIQQGGGMLAYHIFVFGAKGSVVAYGHRKKIPDNFIMEFQLVPSFVGLLFASALLSESKSALVTILVLGMEAVKEVSLLIRAIILIAMAVRTSKSDVSEDWWKNFEIGLPNFRLSHLRTSRPSVKDLRSSVNSVFSPWAACLRAQRWVKNLRRLFTSCQATCLEMRTLMQELAKMSSEELTMESQDPRLLSPENITLLNKASLYLRELALVNLDEILAPIIYVLLSVSLFSDVLGYNAQYFFVFKDTTDDQIAQGIILNLYGISLQLGVFAVISIQLRVLLGVNFLNFLACSIRIESMYWLSFFGALYVAWLTVLVVHAGHHPLYGMEMPWG